MISTTDSNPIPITNWASIAGRWSFEANSAKFCGPTERSTPAGIALSGVQLRDGIVRADLTFQTDQLIDTSGGVILGYAGLHSAYVTVQLGAYNHAYSLGEYLPTVGWRAILNQGSIENLEPNRAYCLEVIQRGQKIILSVDGVRIFEHVLPRPLPGNQVGLFAWGEKNLRFQGVSAQGTEPRLFVAMQFSEPFNTLYSRVIQPKAKSEGFNVVRIDDVARPGIIFEDIQREISEAKAVVAEITSGNANVMYELGYAHALNKPTILLAQRGNELPFDIRSYRVIFYDDTIGGKPALEETLEKHLTSILQEV